MHLAVRAAALQPEQSRESKNSHAAKMRHEDFCLSGFGSETPWDWSGICGGSDQRLGQDLKQATREMLIDIALNRLSRRHGGNMIAGVTGTLSFDSAQDSPNGLRIPMPGEWLAGPMPTAQSPEGL